jgi:glycosyltransferase involved in cell wall biosynthesis
MSDTVNVLIVIDHLSTGGAQEFIYQICSRVAPGNVRLSICAFRTGAYQQKIQALGLPVYILAPKSDPLSYFLALVKLWALLASHRYHVVNTLLQGSFAIATPLARLCRVPTVHSIMAVRSQLQRWYFFLLVWYQRWVKLYLTPIPDELTMAGVSDHKIKLVEVTVDLTSMLNIRHDAQSVLEGLELTNAYPVALSIGRLHPDKGHEYAIRAWPHVLAAWPKARLLIVGDGHDEARLKALVEHLELEGSVLFTGYRSDIESLFSRADIFLRTSINEGVNLTVIQAMAAALPIVGFNNGAPKEIINNNINGLLVDLYDELALSVAILQICTSKGLVEHITRNGRDMVKKYYNIDSVVRFYKKLYEGIAENSPLNLLEDMSVSMLQFEDYFSDGSAYL